MHLMLHADPKDTPYHIAEKACHLVVLTHIPVKILHKGIILAVTSRDTVRGVVDRYRLLADPKKRLETK